MQVGLFINSMFRLGHSAMHLPLTLTRKLDNLKYWIYLALVFDSFNMYLNIFFKSKPQFVYMYHFVSFINHQAHTSHEICSKTFKK